jgi:hypothetical protein
MRLIDRDDDELVVGLTRDELLIINNCLNEACNAIDPWEFSIRVGVEVDEARSLLRRVGSTLDGID